MVATSDLFKKTGSSTVTTLAAPGKALGATSITVGTTTNYPTTTGIIVAIRVVDTTGEIIAGTYTEWSATVTSGTTLAIEAVPVMGSDQIYSAGSTTQVFIPVSSYAHNKLIDGILEEHKQTGAHSDITADNATITNATVTNLTVGTQVASPDWTTIATPPNTVTYNGQRSYSLVFNGVDYTNILSPGQRLKTTRTVAAPTQCTSLNGTSQYWNKTSPNKLTFTNNFVVDAYIKLTSYALGGIVSRVNGTQGWKFVVNADGTLELDGYNGSLSNVTLVKSRQSVPLNKWVRVTAQLDMTSTTNSPTVNYIMIDGVDVPAFVLQGGTYPSSLVQAGNLEVGSYNGGGFLPGKIAQVAIYNAKVTQANIILTHSQGLTGSETSLASAYSFNGVATDLNTTTPNDLTAQGSAVATNADSPFGTQASGLISSTLDYGIVQSAVFSTNTTVVVQVPEGCTIPTSGGVSAVSYSGLKAPYGFSSTKSKFTIESLYCTNSGAVATATNWYNTGSTKFTIPIGSYTLAYLGNIYCSDTAGTTGQNHTNLSYTAANATPVTTKLTSDSYVTATGASTTAYIAKIYAEDSVTLAAAAPVYANIYAENTVDGLGWYPPIVITGGRALTIYAIPDGL